MLGHLAEPGDARRFETDIRIETAGDGAVDDRLLLFFEEMDDTDSGLIDSASCWVPSTNRSG
jgi:hypothetical protein